MNEQEARAVLGVGSSAGIGEAKDAYRNQARLFHPDLLSHLSDEQRAIASQNMARLNEAWALIQSRSQAGILGTPEPRGSSSSGERAPGRAFSVRTRPAYSEECRICGSVPVQHVTFRTVTTFLIWVRLGTSQGPFCRACGLAVYNSCQSSTLLGGWWGIGIFPTILFLFSNWSQAKQLRKSMRPVFRDPGVVTLSDAPMPPMPPLSGRPILWAAPAVAVVVLALVIAGSVASSKARQGGTSSSGSSSNSDGNTTSQPSASASDYLNSCWAPDGSSTDQLQRVGCYAVTAKYRVASITATPSTCGAEGYLSLGSTGMYGCLEKK